MPLDLLNDLLRLYSRRGVEDWKKAPAEVRRRAGQCLGAEIADNDAEAAVTLRAVYPGANANRIRFIPMPLHPRNSGIERCFFIPVCEIKDGATQVGFDLFLLVNAKNCLAYRFEPAHPAPSSHDYGHVQMSRRLFRKTIEPSTPTWIPVEYPAHPLHTSDPLRMFLSMATAVHGYSDGVLQVIQEIFRAASRTRDVAIYFDELKQMLF